MNYIVAADLRSDVLQQMSSRALKYLLNKVRFYGDIWLHFGKAELSHQPEVTGLVYKKLNCELAGLDWCSPQPRGTVGLHMDREDVVCGLFQGKTLQMSIFFFFFCLFQLH